jgi:hypothetical protein
MFVTVELLYGTGGREKEKENDRATGVWMIEQQQVKVEDIGCVLKDVEKCGGGR